MRFHTLNDWLTWQKHLHPRAIDLGLDRVRAVLKAMDLNAPGYTAINVGGTNGKGSCVAFLEAMLNAAGYAVGAYLSPHLVRYNERVRIRGAEASDAELCQAFDAVDQARGNVSLTYFEFGTLAAVELFRRADVDVAVLEVGMGGRLDAVNAVEPAAAVVTSVGIDHREWLGNDRETIAREKAAIYRGGRPAICGDRSPPQSLRDHAREIHAGWQCIGSDFDWQARDSEWHWRGRGKELEKLPRPRLPGAIQLDNAATALAALRALDERLPVDAAAVRQGLQAARLPGRLQHAVIEGRECVLDVAHNPGAARTLAAHLQALPEVDRTVAIFGMLRDKAVEDIAHILDPLISGWYLAPLEGPRGLGVVELSGRLAAAGVAGAVVTAPTVRDAFARAVAASGPHDRIVVCGSFHVVGPILEGADSVTLEEHL